jgi:L-iditol 2-dehydrogenase
MKSVKLAAIKELRITDIPEPDIKDPKDVLIRVKSVGICGSDIHYFKQGKIGSQIIDFPFTVGHEMSGIVEKTGTEVTKVKPGQKIIVDPLVACNSCSQCRIGRYHTCRNQKFLGCPGQLEGCMQEYIVMPQNCCFPITDCVPFETGVICEPLAIGIYAAKQSINLNSKTTGILGSGPIGLSVMLACRDIGVRRIYMTDKLDYRCSFALKNGASWTENPLKEDIVKSITKMEPELLDVVFECCGKQEALDQAVSLVKPGGKIMIIGIPEFDRYSFTADTARRNEITIQHVRRQNECTQLTVDKVSNGSINPHFMATHNFSYTESQKAFELVADYRDGVIKAVIEF